MRSYPPMTSDTVLEWGNQDFTDGCKTCLIPLTRQSERSPYTFEDEDDIEILPMAASKVSLGKHSELALDCFARSSNPPFGNPFLHLYRASSDQEKTLWSIAPLNSLRGPLSLLISSFHFASPSYNRALFQRHIRPRHLL